MFQQLFESVPDAILVCDASGTIVAANERAIAMFGYGLDELLGQPIELFVPHDAKAAHVGYRRAAGPSLRRKMGAGIDLRARRKDGSEIPVDIDLACFQTGDRQMVLAIVRDLTEQRAAQKALRLTQAQLHQSQKMEAIGQLAGGVAHDFNNVLAVMLLRCDLMLRQADGALAEDIRELQAAATRACLLVRQLLTFSRNQGAEARVLAPTLVIEEFASMLRRTVGEDIELQLELDPGDSYIKIEPSRLEQILLNLAVNARDAMPCGGRLSIRTEVVSERGRPHLALVVSDTGVGMTEEVLQRIFEPFFTTKDQTRGTGLGLTIVYGIVHQGGGRVAVESAPGRGTCVRVLLPCVAERPEISASRAPLVGSHRGTETVLVVDDDELVRRAVGKMLRGAGYSVLMASGADEAIEVSDRHPGPIDLLLTDVVMPRMNGFRVADAICARRPAMRVIFMSGFVEHQLFSEASAKRSVDLLAKPFRMAELLTKLSEVLAKPGDAKVG